MDIDVYSYEGQSIRDAAAAIARDWRSSPRPWAVATLTSAEAAAFMDEFAARNIPARLSSPLEREGEFQDAIDAGGDVVHVYPLDDRWGTRPVHLEVMFRDRAGNPTAEARVAFLNGTDLYVGTANGVGGWHVLATATRHGDALLDAAGPLTLPPAVWRSILDRIDESLRGDFGTKGDA